MRNEILKAKGMLAELERKEKLNDAKAKGAVMLIRDILSPWEDDITKLALEKAKASMDELCQIADELKATRTKIAEIRECLQ